MWFNSKTLLQYSCCKTVQNEMANFLYNVFKNCNKRNTDKLGHIIKVPNTRKQVPDTNEHCCHWLPKEFS